MMALRGTGEPDDQDVLYGSITAVPPERETIVGLQDKFLYLQTCCRGRMPGRRRRRWRRSRSCRRRRPR